MLVMMKDGSSRSIKLNMFGAMEGWHIKQMYQEVAMSPRDIEYREKFILTVLAKVDVIINQKPMALTTMAMIDNHLQTWENVQEVLDEMLLFNGINPIHYEDHSKYWQQVGADMAISFVAAIQEVLSPAMQHMIDLAEAQQPLSGAVPETEIPETKAGD